MSQERAIMRMDACPIYSIKALDYRNLTQLLDEYTFGNYYPAPPSPSYYARLYKLYCHERKFYFFYLIEFQHRIYYV